MSRVCPGCGALEGQFHDPGCNYDLGGRYWADRRFWPSQVAEVKEPERAINLEDDILQICVDFS